MRIAVYLGARRGELAALTWNGPRSEAPTWDLPMLLRADLKHAGVTRAHIEADDATRRPLDFHDLRHTYGTWRAIRGDELTKISRAMGHRTTSVAERYVNEAEAFDLKGAAVFGHLRSSLRNHVENVLVGAKRSKLQWPLRGSNPNALSGRGF
jgi:integrase